MQEGVLLLEGLPEEALEGGWPHEGVRAASSAAGCRPLSVCWIAVFVPLSAQSVALFDNPLACIAHVCHALLANLPAMKLMK